MRSIRLVVSSSSAILHQLRWYAFRRLALEVRTGTSESELRELVERFEPHAVVVEAKLAEGTGFGLSRWIKAERQMDVAVVVVADARLSQEFGAQLVSAACDFALVTPLPPGQLYDVLAGKLELPRRMYARASIHVGATATGDGAEAMAVELIDATLTGARVRLPPDAPTYTSVVLTLSPPWGGPVTATGKVVWHKRYRDCSELAVRFVEPSAELKKRLGTLLTWELREDGPRRTVRLLVDLDDRIELSGLAGALDGELSFDLGSVTRINSIGVSRWIKFLQSLPATSRYSFVHCSTAFAQHASYTPQMLGRGRIESLFVPLACVQCQASVEREITRLDMAELASLHCVCGGVLELEVDPKRYFTGLQPG